MQMPGGMDPTQMARVVAHGHKIEAQMRHIQDRLETIRGTCIRLKDVVPMEHGAMTWGEVETYTQEGIVAVEELARLMAVDPAQIMFGGGDTDAPE